MSLTNLLLVAILAFMFAYAATDVFEAAPTALELHEDMMKRFSLK